MRQTTLSDAGFVKYRKMTRKERFLDDMEKIIPLAELAEAIEPFYPKPKGAGRRPVGVERMLRIHFLQHWFNLSDPTAEEALYDSRATQRNATVIRLKGSHHSACFRLLKLIGYYTDLRGISSTIGAGYLKVFLDLVKRYPIVAGNGNPDRGKIRAIFEIGYH